MIRLCSLILLLLIASVISSNVKVEQVPSPRSFCGEGPHWDVATQSLYYIDIDGPDTTLLRYDFKENRTYAATVDGEPLMSFILPVNGTTDQFLIGTKNAAKIIRWDGKSSKGELVRTAFEVELNITTNRFNDAKSDPTGRFFGGTQRLAECNWTNNLPNASFFRYDRENGVQLINDNVAISNGLTWVLPTKKFYYIDSCRYDVLEYDFNIETGELSNERNNFSLKKNGTVPNYLLDGMTSDIDGNLFVATFGGSKVMKIDPKIGKVLAEYKFPGVKQITSVAFGGPNLDILYVTTASRGNQPPQAGHLYQITGLNTSGLPAIKVNV